MTEPLTPEGDAELDAEALAFEVSAVAGVTAGLGAALGPVIAGMIAAFAGGILGSALAERIVKLLRAVAWPQMNPRLQEVAVAAVDLGVDRAVRTLDPQDARKVRRVRGPVLEVPDLDAMTGVRVVQAADLARTLKLQSKTDLNAVIGRVSSVKSRADGQVRWTAHEGMNAGVSAVAERLGAALLWIPERDACLACLAHAGWSVRPGETFPAGLTYGDKPIREDGVLYPPLHPGCRCKVVVWRGEVGPPPEMRARVDAAARLAAEARRSVVYGWTEHESQAATLRAMSRLLRRGAALPASVERRARELVRQGRTLDQPT